VKVVLASSSPLRGPSERRSAIPRSAPSESAVETTPPSLIRKELHGRRQRDCDSLSCLLVRRGHTVPPRRPPNTVLQLGAHSTSMRDTVVARQLQTLAMRPVRPHIQCSNKGLELAGHLPAALRYETRWLVGLIPAPLLLSHQRQYSPANPAHVLQSWFSPLR